MFCWDSEKYYITGDGWKQIDCETLLIYATNVKKCWRSGKEKEWKKMIDKSVEKEDAIIEQRERWKREWSNTNVSRGFCKECGILTNVNNNKICFDCWLQNNKEYQKVKEKELKMINNLFKKCALSPLP